MLKGAYQASLIWAVWVAVGIALGATYLIWLYQRTTLGETAKINSTLRDLSVREMAVFAPLILWALWIGLYPKPFFQVLERPVAQVVERVNPGYYTQHKLVNPLASTGVALSH